MIFGIGIDTIEVERIAKTLSDYGDQFRNRIFTEDESAYCLSRRFSAEHFAARFAAKEAFAKAIGTGIRRGFRWREVEVRKEYSGKPIVLLHGTMIGKVASIVGPDYSVSVSLTHTKELAEAIVIIEKG
ncbi:MAG: holo-ACP synthase [Bacteroidota bacterium]|nr:holo-ACP synthase [Bacteroidota bacterium]MDP4229949.1 holo-ACP synthase [Bacteroidota bacterium]MDP4235638.1 holo-ACP synthase [Bacteroidota bacterium]